MTSQSKNPRRLAISTIEALDEFQKLEELQGLIELALLQLELEVEKKSHASLLLQLYSEKSEEYSRKLRKALETIHVNL